MSATKPGIYAPINVHADRVEAWPQVMPKLTEEEATRAFKRLWRFSMGTTYDRPLFITSGNRRAVRMAWKGNAYCAHINPSQGWRDFVHDASHWFDYLANGETKHGKHHARFETKLIKEVIKRGWLEGALRDKPKAAPVVVPIVDPLKAKREKKLASIEARMVNWERKQRRAERALAKLTRQRAYYVKALA